MNTSKFVPLTKVLKEELSEAIEAESYSVSVIKKLQQERAELALQLDRRDNKIRAEKARRLSHTDVLLSTLRLIHSKNIEVHKQCNLCTSNSCYNAWYLGTEQRVK